MIDQRTGGNKMADQRIDAENLINEEVESLAVYKDDYQFDKLYGVLTAFLYLNIITIDEFNDIFKAALAIMYE